MFKIVIKSFSKITSFFAELLSGAHINYWHCAEIVEILKETEKETKNFFGQYGSQRLALWKEIVTLYQKENIYLGEGAQLLTQAVSYDLPGIVDINCYFKLTSLLRGINLFGFASIARKRTFIVLYFNILLSFYNSMPKLIG
jgi:hypothetical protein